MRTMAMWNLILTVLITVALLVLPLYEGHQSRRDQTQGTEKTLRMRGTLLEVNGMARALVVLSVPLVLSVVPIFFSRVVRVIGFLLLVFAILSGATIGLWYVPGAAILLFGGRRGDGSVANSEGE